VCQEIATKLDFSNVFSFEINEFRIGLKCAYFVYSLQEPYFESSMHACAYVYSETWIIQTAEDYSERLSYEKFEL